MMVLPFVVIHMSCILPSGFGYVFHLEIIIVYGKGNGLKYRLFVFHLESK